MKPLASCMLLAVALSALPFASEAGQHRSTAVKREFKASNPCPANGKRSGKCPGYVIDHVRPLACGGVDGPNNMQWQTTAEGKAKDKWERKWC